VGRDMPERKSIPFNNLGSVGVAIPIFLAAMIPEISLLILYSLCNNKIARFSVRQVADRARGVVLDLIRAPVAIICGITIIVIPGVRFLIVDVIVVIVIVVCIIMG
jgi:uncharacterized protein YacL